MYYERIFLCAVCVGGNEMETVSPTQQPGKSVHRMVMLSVRLIPSARGCRLDMLQRANNIIHAKPMHKLLAIARHIALTSNVNNLWQTSQLAPSPRAGCMEERRRGREGERREHQARKRATGTTAARPGRRPRRRRTGGAATPPPASRARACTARMPGG